MYITSWTGTCDVLIKTSIGSLLSWKLTLLASLNYWNRVCYTYNMKCLCKICGMPVIMGCSDYVNISGSYLLDRPPTPEKPMTGQSKVISHENKSMLSLLHVCTICTCISIERGRHSGLLHTEDFTNGDLDDYSPSPSARSSPAPSTRYKYSRFVLQLCVC